MREIGVGDVLGVGDFYVGEFGLAGEKVREDTGADVVRKVEERVAAGEGAAVRDHGLDSQTFVLGWWRGGEEAEWLDCVRCRRECFEWVRVSDTADICLLTESVAIHQFASHGIILLVAEIGELDDVSEVAAQEGLRVCFVHCCRVLKDG